MISPVTRITIALKEPVIARLRALSESLVCSQAKIITCLLDMSDEEIKKVVDEKLVNLFLSPAKERAKEKFRIRMERRAALDAIKALTPEQLANLLANFKTNS